MRKTQSHYSRGLPLCRACVCVCISFKWKWTVYGSMSARLYCYCCYWYCPCCIALLCRCISSLTNLFILCVCVCMCASAQFFFQLCSRFVRSHFDFNLYVLLLIFSSLVFMCLWCFCFLSYRHILFIIRSAFEMEKWSHKIFRCVCVCLCARTRASLTSFSFFFLWISICASI